MKIHAPSRSGLTLVELSITSGIVGILGLIIYSLLNVGAVLGAKNTAMNTAHQQARVAMLKMIDDIHSAVSLPTLQDVVGNQAAGISFQQWSGGPHKIRADAAAGNSVSPQKTIRIIVTAGQPTPAVGQRLIVPTHQIEDRISAVSGTAGDLSITLDNNLPVAIKGTGTTFGDVICYVTDRCSYTVVKVSDGPPAEYKLQWTRLGTRDIVNDITNPRPFSIPPTPAGALYYRFVAAIDLSTSDAKYSKRGYKAANILLNGQVPFKARLTTFQ